MDVEIESILKNVLQRIKPTESEFRYLYSLFDRIKRDLEMCFYTIDKGFNITLQGSLAKNTFIRGRADIDIFVLFRPSEVNSEWIDRIFIPLVLECLQANYRLMIKYASHPYITAYIDNIEINIVPAYNVDSPSNIISAVDRTPFHTMYIVSKLSNALKDEVRILKHFLATWNLYGAEINIRGFSGYLTELLILAYGTFLNLLRESQQWKAYKTCVDIEKQYRDENECIKVFKNDVLVVVDPIDPRRNAAAAVSLKTFSIFKLLAQLFLRNPSYKFFDREQEPSIDENSLSKYVKERIESINSCLIGIEFEVIKPIPDIVWGQLNRVERIVKNTLKSHEIKHIYIDTWIDGEFKKAIVMVEILNCSTSYELKKGPPSYITDEAINFIVKNIDAFIGPWIDKDGRLYCIKRRKFKPSEIIVLAIRDLTLSSLKFIRCIESVDALPLYNEEFRRWLKQYLDRKMFSDIIALFRQSD